MRQGQSRSAPRGVFAIEHARPEATRMDLAPLSTRPFALRPR